MTRLKPTKKNIRFCICDVPQIIDIIEDKELTTKKHEKIIYINLVIISKMVIFRQKNLGANFVFLRG